MNFPEVFQCSPQGESKAHALASKIKTQSLIHWPS